MGRFRIRGKRKKLRREGQDRIPLRAILPNLITSLAACAGISSIAMASEGRFEHALYALLVACVCDGMDGRVARLLNASSKLGAELDSLADFVNFGVAPALYMFFWLTGKTFGADASEVSDPRIVRLVLGCSLFYAMCDCFRLARFNTMLEADSLPYWKHFFTGVPAPGGCWMVLTPAILSVALEDYVGTESVCAWLHNPAFGMFMLLFVGALMASRLPTISLKAVHLHGRTQVRVFVAAMLFVIGLLFADHWLTIGISGLVYFLTVPVSCAVFIKKRKNYERTLTNIPEKV